MEVGPLGWTRRLVCDKSARVSIRPAKWQKNDVPQHLIQVECQGNTLKFGSPIPDEAKAFIAESVRRMIAERVKSAGFPGKRVQPPPDHGFTAGVKGRQSLARIVAECAR